MNIKIGEDVTCILPWEAVGLRPGMRGKVVSYDPNTHSHTVEWGSLIEKYPNGVKHHPYHANYVFERMK